ncbi:MAG: hypothetical protein HY787_12755 [Deltaproteobacteria bacterium]|nr:hypothetical protein [Deltaproteobacteria bacterium]
MARMHPEEIETLDNATPGERTVFRFLREVANWNWPFDSAHGHSMRNGFIYLFFLAIGHE